ncbi:MAG: sigma-70 family RNA polymerase sigma factor [Armatimonadetes bacterium]|nr:sigma-70 family RNA polymerase sigma factor [Armatimonadota bacterium]
MADSPLPQPEDAALVRQARSGDRRAFETLFNRYQGRIYNIVFQAVRNRADADDVTQEVFIQAFRMLPSLRAEGAFASWLYRIALNRARNWRRDHPQGRTVSLSDYTTGEEDIPERDLPDESPGPEDLFERKSARHSVQQAIATLSDDHREVIVLHHLEGLPVEEIASALGVAQGTVKSRLARARNELKRKLKPFVEEM